VAQRAKRADRALARLERHLERCERDRVAANDRFSARSMDAAESREGLKRRLAADRAAIREAAQQRRSAIQARLRDLDKIERESLDRLLRSTQDRHVRKRLRRTHLLLTRIPGLPWYARWRLWAQGIRNAEHVTSRAPRLASLPSPQVTAILLWRVEAEAAAKRSMPASAPKHRSRPIAETAGRRRRQLERALRRVDIWEGELLSLLERKHERRMANVEEQVRAASERLQHDLAHIEERVAEVRDRQPVEAHRLAQAERELEPYRAIDFGRFLRFLLLP
jgi:DNA-binding helix-hairpin-helix protein with protein kinase domain